MVALFNADNYSKKYTTAQFHNSFITALALEWTVFKEMNNEISDTVIITVKPLITLFS